jgi:hypothetical protein
MAACVTLARLAVHAGRCLVAPLLCLRLSLLVFPLVSRVGSRLAFLPDTRVGSLRGIRVGSPRATPAASRVVFLRHFRVVIRVSGRVVTRLLILAAFLLDSRALIRVRVRVGGLVLFRQVYRLVSPRVSPRVVLAVVRVGCQRPIRVGDRLGSRVGSRVAIRLPVRAGSLLVSRPVGPVENRPVILRLCQVANLRPCRARFLRADPVDSRAWRRVVGRLHFLPVFPHPVPALTPAGSLRGCLLVSRRASLLDGHRRFHQEGPRLLPRLWAPMWFLLS